MEYEVEQIRNTEVSWFSHFANALHQYWPLKKSILVNPLCSVQNSKNNFAENRGETTFSNSKSFTTGGREKKVIFCLRVCQRKRTCGYVK